MKKCRMPLALLLALLLMFVSAFGALAYEDADPPLWEQWGYDSLQDFMDSMDLESEEEYYEYIAEYVEAWKQQEEEQRRWIAWRDEYLAAHPDALQGYLNRSPALWEELDYDSLEEFMQWNGLETEEEYEDYLLQWYLYDAFQESLRAEQIVQERIRLGGPAEGVGIMWNGAYVSFPDARPEIRDDRTMVPVRAFMECVGAEVSYEAGVVALRLTDGRALRFTVGETTVMVADGAVENTLEMDVAPYIKEDRTYVPIRFFSEALGLDVLWDEDYSTAVILDRCAVTAETDKSFTVVNRALALEARDAAATYKTTAGMRATLTAFDSIYGNKTAQMSGNLTALTCGQNIDMKGSFDLTSLVLLLQSQFPEEEIGELADYLGRTDFEMICNAGEETMYLKSPLLDSLSGAEGAWVTMPLPLEDIGGGGQATVGSLLYEMYCANSGDIHCLEYLDGTARRVAEVIGDDCFEERGGGWELRYGIDEIGLLYEELTGLPSEGMKDTSFRLRVEKNGAYSGSLAVTTDGYGQTVQILADFSTTGSGSTVSMTFHLKNQFKLVMTLQSSTSATSEKLRTEPPAGATVISPDDFGAGGMPLPLNPGSLVLAAAFVS